jgi:hypothetical protein
MSGRPNKAKVVEACTRRIRGLGAYAKGRASFAINGRKLALAEVVALYQRCLDERAAVAKLRAEILEKLGAIERLEAERLEADRALKAWARDEFGMESKEAIDLGFPPPKKGVLTVEAKALAVARAKATRKARYTLGKKQREAIKGSLGGDADVARVPESAPEESSPWVRPPGGAAAM